MHHTYTYTSCDNQTPVGSILAAPCQPILSETEGSEGSDRIEIREMPGPRDSRAALKLLRAISKAYGRVVLRRGPARPLPATSWAASSHRYGRKLKSFGDRAFPLHLWIVVRTVQCVQGW